MLVALLSWIGSIDQGNTMSTDAVGNVTAEYIINYKNNTKFENTLQEAVEDEDFESLISTEPCDDIYCEQ